MATTLADLVAWDKAGEVRHMTEAESDAYERKRAEFYNKSVNHRVREILRCPTCEGRGGFLEWDGKYMRHRACTACRAADRERAMEERLMGRTSV